MKSFKAFCNIFFIKNKKKIENFKIYVFCGLKPLPSDKSNFYDGMENFFHILLKLTRFFFYYSYISFFKTGKK